MAKAIKPTKQQIAQGKARAGGNNPINVTNAGLKKLGSAALIAASFTPAGRAVKVAAKVAGKNTTKAVVKAKTISNNVKVKAPDKSTPESVRIARNIVATEMAKRIKSGELAKTTASRVNTKAGNYLTSANPTGKAKVVNINTDPTKPKGVFGPLKKKLAAADTPANRAKAKANTRGLKAANKKKK